MELNIIKNTIKAGLDKPVTFIQMTDSHFTFEDEERDSGRWDCYEPLDNKGQSEQTFRKIVEYAKQNNYLIVHTGDVTDFLSKANLKFLDENFKDLDYMLAAGNHDFCHWVGEATEDHAYKWEMMKRIAPHHKTNLYFDSRLVGGVNIVTMDDSYYLITDGQIDMLKAEVAKGYPIILCMHVPLYAEGLASKAAGNEKYLVCAPSELLDTYSEYRKFQQTPDEATIRAVEYIKNEPLIKALLTGHRHVNNEEYLDSGLLQLTTNGSFSGTIREITVI